MKMPTFRDVDYDVIKNFITMETVTMINNTD